MTLKTCRRAAFNYCYNLCVSCVKLPQSLPNVKEKNEIAPAFLECLKVRYVCLMISTSL